MNETFTHLRVHSHYTLLGATATVEQLVAHAAAEGLSALVLTDSAVLYGAVAFNEACRAANIQPIVGLTLRVTLPEAVNLPGLGWGELVLLAKGAAGYRSLCGLSSLVQGSTQREYLLKNGLAWEALRPFTQNLIAIDSGKTGWLARLVAAKQHKQAARHASRLVGLFEEDAYLGVTLQRPDDITLAQASIGVAARFGLQAVALQPVFCLEPAEATRLRLLAAIDQNCHMNEVPAETLPGGGAPDAELHWLPHETVAERFAELPEAVPTVGTIVEQCEPALPDGSPIWPKLALPAEQTVEAVLAEAAQVGLQQKYGRSPKKAITERLTQELDLINRQGFAPLFLLVADITRFARETAVPVNTRGSVANSLVAYCLGITNVDPIGNELLFERFLNPARANLPDIDLDFCSRRRDEVLNYVRQKYGEDRVALVATISTMQPKSAVRETAKVHGLAEPEIKALTALLPRGWHPDPRRRSKKALEDLLAQVKDVAQQNILATAFEIIGQPHHMSIHPGGIVISPGPMTDFVPVQLAPKGFLTTQYDHRDVEKIGLPKIDLLGIRALTVLADTAAAIRTTLDPDFDLLQIPLDDEETAVHLQKGDTIGVFQCESSGARRTLRQLKATNLRDLAVANAFFKPGPATGGMAQAFVRRYRGEEQVRYLHPALEPILNSTQGVLLFQEQILRVATEIAHLSWAKADHLRRGMSKFKAAEMAAMKQRFVGGCQAKSDFTEAQAETLWEQVMAFAGYGFNQGHATAYADVSYRSAYLKAHYPAQFLCARLRDYGGFHHPAIYIAEAQRLGIGVRPPHINFSGRKFTLTAGEIRDWRLEIEPQKSPISNLQSPILWMGLGQVRDLRRAAVRAIVQERVERPFTSLRDLLSRVDLQKREVTHLIQCGALTGLGQSRAALLAEATDVARAGSAHQLGFDLGLQPQAEAESVAEQLAWETAVLGWPVSANPLAVVQEQTSDDVPLRLLPRLKNQKTTIAGVRLPGWTGGRGFYFGDGDSFEIVRLAETAVAKSKPKLWLPYRLTGFWRKDPWGGGWFEAVKSATLG
ncbi:DNA polymerase III subunit alpha [Candidatus Leptofilum sp.]|uniref:DNA polymerase III subunit alpha n=1 Tax=Candidatus Leptofilum sp. TaxID=3241576 RepID=UPI003B5CB164